MTSTLPLVVNLFGGPGCGKSTMAALLFGEVKCRYPELVAELTTEFAKDLVWEGRYGALRNQVYVIGEQHQRIERVVGKVDTIITDSPVLLSAIYRPGDYPPAFDELAHWLHRRFPSVNVLLERPQGAFEKEGRIQDYDQSLEIDTAIRELLEDNAISYVKASPTPEDAERIARHIHSACARKAAA